MVLRRPVDWFVAGVDNGHGLGTSYEDPLITDSFPQHFENKSGAKTPAADLIIHSSMLIELHPNVFVPDVGGAAVGEMLITTPHGIKSLLKFPTKLFEL